MSVGNPVSLPQASARLVDVKGFPTREFYRFFQSLASIGDADASATQIAAIKAQIAAIQKEIDDLPASSYPRLDVLNPLFSHGLLQNGYAQLGVNVADSITVNGIALQLDGDVDVPGNTYFYGTGLTGVKGWQALSGVLHDSDRVAVTFGDDGTATFDLKALADSGTGTFKLVTRDSYGRLSGTKDGTTTDVPEGTRLYFTAARVLTTVLAGLSTATNAVITAADTVLSALGKLQAQITANTAKFTASFIGGADTRVTNWNSGLSTTTAFRLISSASGSTNGPGSNFYAGIRAQYADGTLGGGSDVVARATGGASELWFRGISSGSAGAWLRAADTTMLMSDTTAQTNLNTLAGTQTFSFTNTAIGAPSTGSGYDAVGLQIAGPGQTTQLAFDGTNVYTRSDDGAGFGGWMKFTLTAL